MLQTEEKIRYHLLDTLRGIALINMTLYHLFYSMVYIFNYPIKWFDGELAKFWQQCICWTFILVAGATLNLSNNQLVRGVKIFFCGLIVTLVTILVTPANRIIFGILSFMGTAIIATHFLMPVFEKLNKKIMSVFMFILFLVTKPITNYRFDIKGLFFLGIKSKEFFSTDYFPLIPWLFLFWTGYFLFGIILQNFEAKNFLKLKIPFVSYIGKHTLIIYMLHQPVIFLVGNIITYLKK